MPLRVRFSEGLGLIVVGLRRDMHFMAQANAAVGAENIACLSVLIRVWANRVM